jgi:hypothetical protein
MINLSNMIVSAMNRRKSYSAKVFYGNNIGFNLGFGIFAIISMIIFIFFIEMYKTYEIIKENSPFRSVSNLKKLSKLLINIIGMGNIYSQNAYLYIHNVTSFKNINKGKLLSLVFLTLILTCASLLIAFKNNP